MAKLSVSAVVALVAVAGLTGCAAQSTPPPVRTCQLPASVVASTASTAASSVATPRSEQRLSTSSGHNVAQLRAAVSASRQALKSQLLAHRSYSLTSRDGSFSGVTWSYELDVTDNEVVARRYQQWDHDGAKMESWTELGPDVGAHDGGPRNNLDQLYGQCLDKVLSQPSGENDFYVTISEKGTLASCVYVPKGCQDDCSEGVLIDKVSWR